MDTRTYLHKVFSFIVGFIVAFGSFLFIYSYNNLTKEYEQIKSVVEQKQTEIALLNNKIEQIEAENELLKEEIQEINNGEVEITVGEELNLTDEEKELFAKFIAYYCKNETTPTKIYVGGVIINRVYEQKIPFIDVINSFEVEQNNLEAVTIENEDVVVSKLLHSTREVVDRLTSGATYFYNSEKIPENAEKQLLLVFKSGKYTFFCDLSVG